MPKPEKLIDLIDHNAMADARNIAKEVFNSYGTSYKIEGYHVNLPDFDSLAGHVQDFICKAVLQSTVTNILDQKESADVEGENQ